MGYVLTGIVVAVVIAVVGASPCVAVAGSGDHITSAPDGEIIFPDVQV